MIRKRQQLVALVLALLDGLLLVIAYLLSVWLWLTPVRHDSVNMAASHSILPAAVFYAALVVLVQALLGSYDPARSRRLRQEVPACWGANLLGVLVGMSLMYLLRLSDFSRGVLAVSYLMGCLLLTLRHVLTGRLLRRLRSRGYNRRHVLVVGTGELALRYRDNLLAHPELGFDIAGFFGPEREGLTVLGGLDRLEEGLAVASADEVIIALDEADSPRTQAAISACERAGLRACVIPAYNDLIPHSVTVESIGSTRLISLRSNPLDNVGGAFVKRTADIVLSLLALVLLSPLLLISMLGVRLSGPGPVLFRQERVGLNKKTFTMLKLRTMRQGSEKQPDGWTTADDPRRTRFGALLRKCSIDELPQLVNVLKGDMSLVGPRPEIPYFVEQYARTVPRYMVKHQVRPGMTGWAQINGWRGDTDIATRVVYDVWYIEHWSLGLDLRILVRTALGGFINSEKVGGGKA